MASCLSLRLLRRRWPPAARTSSMSVLNVSAPRCGLATGCRWCLIDCRRTFETVSASSLVRQTSVRVCRAIREPSRSGVFGCNVRTFEGMFGTQVRIRPSRPRAGCDSSRRCEMSAVIATTRPGAAVPTHGASRRGVGHPPSTDSPRSRRVHHARASLPLVVWALVAVLGSGGAAADIAPKPGVHACRHSFEYVTVGHGRLALGDRRVDRPRGRPARVLVDEIIRSTASTTPSWSPGSGSRFRSFRDISSSRLGGGRVASMDG